MSQGLGLPRDVSLDGFRIDDLMGWTHLFNGLLFVILCGWLGWAILRHGRRHAAVYDRGDSRRSVVLSLCLAVFVFAVIDGHLFLVTLSGMDDVFWNFRRAEETPGAVRIQVNAHQWAWDGRYAGEDGRFATEDDVVTWNDFKVPVGAPVVLQLTSTDVIHSFYLPNFRVKMDAVPGQVNRLWFQAQEEGTFEVGCAEHCGVNHYKMRATVTALPREAFDRWHAQASETGRRAYDPADAEAHWGWEWKP